MASWARENEKKGTEKIHSSRIPSRKFQNILERFCIQFDLYPSFIIINAPRRRTLQDWGEVPLPRIPVEELHPDTKYWLLNGLSYHAIAPCSEANRLMLRYVISNLIRRFSTDSPAVSWISGIFCTLLSYTKLSRTDAWEAHVREAIKWNIEVLKEKEKGLLTDFVRSYFQHLLGEEGPPEYRTLVERTYTILKQPLEMREKVETFIKLIKNILKSEAVPLVSLQDKVEDFTSSIGSPFQTKDFWGENWRARGKSSGVTPEDVAKLARISQDDAMTLAKKLEERESKTVEKLQSMGTNWLPRYSKRQEMLQKLLAQRRYIAAVRRVRLKLLLEKIGRLEGRRRMEIGGKTNWSLGEDPEELDIEASVETFGHLIPNLTTLRNFWVKSTSGERRGGGRHIELLIDTSKSMEGPPLERAIDVGLALIEKAKERDDYVGLTTFSSGAWEGFPPCRSYHAVEEILLRLLASGGTNLRHALQVVEDHLVESDWSSSLFLLTDTAIWDINYPNVRRKLMGWAEVLPVQIIALTPKVYPDTRDAFKHSDIKLIHAPHLDRSEWELVLSTF